jgi:cobalt/nickel transport system permease protein
VSIHTHLLDRYHYRKSPVHDMDARVKLVLTLAFIVTVSLTPPGAWVAFPLFLSLTLSVALLSDLGVIFVLSRSLIALPFALAAVTTVFARPGQPLWSLSLLGWQLTATDQGLTFFVSILLKSWLSVQMATLLAATTTFPDLLAAMRALHVPRILTAIALLMYRYIFVLVNEAARLQRARDARSADPHGGGGGAVVWRAQVFGGMVGNLLVRSYERSERVYAAMLARGYKGELLTLGRTPLPGKDLVVAAAFIGFLLFTLLAAIVI